VNIKSNEHQQSPCSVFSLNLLWVTNNQFKSESCCFGWGSTLQSISVRL